MFTGSKKDKQKFAVKNYINLKGSAHPQFLKLHKEGYNWDNYDPAIHKELPKRINILNEKGEIIDGDQIIAMIAKNWKKKKILKG